MDLAEPDRVQFVIAGGNGGRAGSPFATDQYPLWLAGGYHTVSFVRDEIEPHETWYLAP